MKFTAVRENHLYQKAYSKGKKFVTPNCAIYILPDYQKNKLQKAHPLKITVNRIGLTTSKKLGGAVVRSRTRRILREAYRLLEKEYQIKKGFIIIIAARDGATTKKSTEIYQDFKLAFSKLGMIEQ